MRKHPLPPTRTVQRFGKTDAIEVAAENRRDAVRQDIDWPRDFRVAVLAGPPCR
jgi:hypothetical protein